MTFARVALAAAAVLIAAGSAAAQDFKPLHDGKTWTGFKFILGKEVGEDFGKQTTWKLESDGTIVCNGKPNGYFFTAKSFKNYHVRFEVKYARPKDLTDDAKFSGNSGFLVHIEGDAKVWPKSVEVQGMNRDMGNIFSIAGAPKGNFKKDAEAQKKAIKPVGEWNVVEIISADGKLTCKINGTQVAEGASDLKQGPIGWQSEGAEIHFRKIEIKEMP
jgi:hypothetical protein